MRLKKCNGPKGEGEFRLMTLDEAKCLTSGRHIWFKVYGSPSARQCEVHGNPRRWGEYPDKIEIMVKYGLHNYGTFTQSDILRGRLLVEVEAKRTPADELIDEIVLALGLDPAQAVKVEKIVTAHLQGMEMARMAETDK